MFRSTRAVVVRRKSAQRYADWRESRASAARSRSSRRTSDGEKIDSAPIVSCEPPETLRPVADAKPEDSLSMDEGSAPASFIPKGRHQYVAIGGMCRIERLNR